MRSNADHSPDITNMTAPTGTITTIRKIITSQPISLPGYFFEALFTVPTSSLATCNEWYFLLHIYSSKNLKYSSIQTAYILQAGSYTFVSHRITLRHTGQKMNSFLKIRQKP